MSIVDKLFMVRMLEYSKEVTQAYDHLNLKEVYEKTMDFVVKEVAEFYLDFTKYRRRRLSAHSLNETPAPLSPEEQSMLATVQYLYITLLQTAAPILPFTAQEAYEQTPDAVVSAMGDRAPTVFQMGQWHEERLMGAIDAKMLGQFEVREKWGMLRELRDLVRNLYEEKGVLDAVPKRSYQNTRLHFIVPSVDSDEAALLELLQNDLSDFFFGIPQITIETKD